MIERRKEIILTTEASVAVALSVLLGNIRLLELPNGGSIAFATLPIVSIALCRGTKTGFLAGTSAGLAHLLAGGTIIHPAQAVLDYIVAYSVLGIAGIKLTKVPSKVMSTTTILLAMLLHLLAMVASGMIFFSTTAQNATFFYALTYNATTVIPETLLTLILARRLAQAITRANPVDVKTGNLTNFSMRTPRPPRRHQAQEQAKTRHVLPPQQVPEKLSNTYQSLRRHPLFLQHQPTTIDPRLGTENSLVAQPKQAQVRNQPFCVANDAASARFLTPSLRKISVAARRTVLPER